MKIALIHNAYGRPSGEEMVVERLAALLAGAGHTVSRFSRSSAELGGSRLGTAKAFFTGLCNPSSRRALRRFLAEDRPDVVNVHNVFPLISPAALDACGQAGIPVVMTVHNYRLICPNGLFYTHDQRCERCCGGREYWCFFRNCERSLPKSLGYAFRNAFARWRGYFRRNVTAYATLTRFQREKLVENGFPAERIVTIPNAIDLPAAPPEPDDGAYVAYAGRISHEKGLPLLLDAARRCPEIPFRIAGHAERGGALLKDLPANVEYLGSLAPPEVVALYRKARIVTMQSTCYEGFPLGLLEAMREGRPSIGPRHGGFPEIIDDGQTGLLFNPGDAADLAAKIQTLWENPVRAREIGLNGFEKCRREYSTEVYLKRWTELFQRVIEDGKESKKGNEGE